jgi:hypothetical protein
MIESPGGLSWTGSLPSGLTEKDAVLVSELGVQDPGAVGGVAVPVIKAFRNGGGTDTAPAPNDLPRLFL